MTISVQLAIWLIAVVAACGAFQGLVLWRLRRIEEMLGNGKPGKFALQKDMDLVAGNYVKRSELEFICKAQHAEVMAKLDLMDP